MSNTIKKTVISVNFVKKMNLHLKNSASLMLLLVLLASTSNHLICESVRVSFSENSTSASSSKSDKGRLIIQVINLKNNSGKIIFHLFATERGKYFPTKSSFSSLRVDSKIKNNQLKIIIEDLPYGEYAYTLHHDENNNKKMDKTWLGFPDEGWALSNDLRPVLSMPDFDDGKFHLSKPNLEITTTLNY